MQSPGDNDMGKSREQRTREARAAKAEAARLAAEAEAARLAAEGAGSSEDIAEAGLSTSSEESTQPGTSTAAAESAQPVTLTGSAAKQPESVTQPARIVPPPPPPPGGGRVLSSLIASTPPDAGLTSPASLVSPNSSAPPPPPFTSGAPMSGTATPGTGDITPSASDVAPTTSNLSPVTPSVSLGVTPSTSDSAPNAVAPSAATTGIVPSAPPQHAQNAQDPQLTTVTDRPIRQRIIGASQPGINSQPPAQGAPPPRMIGLPNPDGVQVPPGSPTQAAPPAPQAQAPAPPQPIPIKREPRPEPGMTLEGKVCRHEYVRIYQRKLKGLDRRLVATRAFLPVGFKMGDFTYLSAGSFCFCSKCRKRLFPKRTEAEKQQARVERKLLKEMGGVDLLAVGKPREKTGFDDELEDELDFLDDSDDETGFGKLASSDNPEPSEEPDENLDDDKLKLDIHVDELEVESVDVEDIKAEGVKLTPDDDFDEACSLDVDEES